VRNVNYFRGWPADFPVLSASGPAGWADSIYVTWAHAWANRLADLTSGAADFVAVPRQNLADAFKSSTSPYAPPNYPIDGVRDMQPLPTLSVNAFFFTFNINPATPFGPIGPPGVFNESLIPNDFFGNQTWGVNVRKAFAQAFDYNTYISTVFGGEASHPATAIIPGLSYYDPTVTGWSYNLAAANASLNLAGPDSNGRMLKDVGFKLTLAYPMLDAARQTACKLLANAIQSLNPVYHVTVTSYFTLPLPVTIGAHMFPMFIAGWLADYPDPHDFAEPFYHTGGNFFAAGQAYSNPAMDALIDAGINTSDGSARAQIYHNIQVLAVQDCPSFTLVQPVGRHFERDWVVDWYYDSIYSGFYFYNLWKWYYVPTSLLDNSTNPPPATSSPSFYLPADTNYDGKVDMRDIGLVASAFGAQFGLPIDGRWNFREDVNNDRKIDMKDIGYIARQFGKSSPVWPLPNSTINGPGTVTQGTPAAFTEAVTAPSGYSVSVNSVVWGVSHWPGPLVQQQTGQSLNFTYTFPAAGTYYVVNDVVYTVNTPYGNVTTSMCEVATVTVR
jgi:peptide/nickel transport system substrate-binding protein